MVQRLPLKLSLGVIFLLELLLFACSDSNVLLDETTSFEEELGWVQKQPIHFDLTVEDTLSTYTMYVVVRQNNAYPFYNLYFTPSVIDGKGKTVQKGLAETILYDPVTGKPEGDGFGDIYEKKFLIYTDLKLPHAGKYQIQLEQAMRVDTLAGMVSMGLLLEKRAHGKN